MEGFKEAMSLAWNINVTGYHMFILYTKLKHTKRVLRDFSKEHGKNLSSQIFDAVSMLEDLNKELDTNGPGDNLLFRISKSKEDYLKLISFEASVLKQKSKIKWLKEGDENSAYFHKCLTLRHHFNKINSITDANGIFHDDPIQVRQAFIDYYNMLLGSSCDIVYPGKTLLAKFVMNTISPNAYHDLCKPITAKEIKDCVFSFNSNKAPGPDGFNAQFFKDTWHIIGDDVTAAILEFFKSGKLLSQVNATIIALIPKGQSPSSVKEYRPISCCNTIYKCISKIISERLKPLLNDLIPENQTAFISGRAISENIFLAQELLRDYHKGVPQDRMTLKIDIMKAFDSLRWDFLWDLLELIGMPNMVIGWIKACITSPTYSICINGSLHGFIKGKKGLRQGDPLSPYLFVLAMSVLSNILNLASTSSDFNYHWKCSNSKLNHLSFADDLLIFCKADVGSAQLIKDSLSVFSALSGLQA